MGDDNNRSWLYIIVAICVFGAILIGALSLYKGTSYEANRSEHFSEVFFEDNMRLPRMVTVGDEVNLSFAVVSHENSKTAYKYNVTCDNEKIQSGFFTLDPRNGSSSKETVQIAFKPRKSGLVSSGLPSLKIFKSTMNVSYYLLANAVNNGQRYSLVSSEKGYSLVYWGQNNTSRQIDVAAPNKRLFSYSLPTGAIPENIELLAFDPLKNEIFIANSTTIEPIGRPSSVINSSENQHLSELGFTISKSNWKILNDHGLLKIERIGSVNNYYYTFEKVSVNVTPIHSGANDDLSTYELHFWIIVTEPINYLVYD